MPKRHQAAYIQLKTGIGYLKPYFRKIGKAEDDKCFGDCNFKQTTKHLLLECPSYSEERKRMRKALGRLPLTLQILLCTREGKNALATFLGETEICTAGWYINGGQKA